jgi:hypothetical protein
MGTLNLRAAAAWLAFGALALAASVATEVKAQARDVDPAAAQILKRMTDYLGSLQRFSLDTQNIFDDVLESGQKIQYDLLTAVVVQRPNKMRSERKGDLVSEVVIYDGKTITAYNGDNKYYAVTPAPDNLDDALVFASTALGIVPPSGDLIYRNAFDLLTAHVTSGNVVGKSMIGGVKCDHLAFTGPLVDWQIWIADGDKPLPRKYVITTKDDPAQPQYIVLMSNWNVSPNLSDALFTFTPPQGTKKADFVRLDTGETARR